MAKNSLSSQMLAVGCWSAASHESTSSGGPDAAVQSMLVMVSWSTAGMAMACSWLPISDRSWYTASRASSLAASILAAVVLASTDSINASKLRLDAVLACCMGCCLLSRLPLQLLRLLLLADALPLPLPVPLPFPLLLPLPLMAALAGGIKGTVGTGTGSADARASAVADEAGAPRAAAARALVCRRVLRNTALCVTCGKTVTASDVKL